MISYYIINQDEEDICFNVYLDGNIVVSNYRLDSNLFNEWKQDKAEISKDLMNEF